MIIQMTNTGAKLHGADGHAVSIVYDLLSYDEENRTQRKAGWGMGSWNSKKSFLRLPDHVFEAGFVPMVKRALSEAGYPVTIRDERREIEPEAIEVKLNGIELRDYQLRAIDALVQAKRGVLQVATGGGKTEIGIGATQRLGLRTLWLTHKLDLVGQTRKRYRSRLGRDVGMISEGEWMPSDITVATVQTLMSWLKKQPEKVEQFLHGIEFLVVDEAHRSSGNSFFTIISRCINAYFRASLTATPLMKGKREDDLKLIATSGPIIYKLTNNDLIEMGVLARPYFRFVEVPKFGWNEAGTRRKLRNKGVKKTAMAAAVYQAAYDQGIVHNDVRNRMIVEDAQTLVDEGRKTVILVQREKHGYILEEMIANAGLRVAWVYGKDDAETRDRTLRQLASDELDVLIASTILDEGLDEPSISGIILAGGGKSQISLFQRVGRSVRAKKGEALERFGNTARIIDYVDTGQKVLMKHAAQRFKAVKEEEGWVIDKIESWDERRKSLTGVGEQLQMAV